MDVFDKDKRSWIMSRVHGQGITPEIAVCSMVHRLGYRFRKNSSKLPGKPDIVLKRHKKIIFVHGCFWHGHENCKRSSRPTTNTEFWNKKLDTNIVRDRNNLQILQSHGWRVLTVWQCELRNPDSFLDKIKDFLES
ncbi:MAG: very short patch repair endonuclease [Bacillota bacterium]